MAYSKFNVLYCLGVGLVLFSICGEGKEILVGGHDNSWKIPSSPDDLNKWAQKVRFHIGDTLVFTYDTASDAVIKVSEGAYKSCDTTKPVETYRNSTTEVKLNENGLHFFISGVKENCDKGEKLQVKVLSKHRHDTPQPAPSPTSHAPAPSPTTLAPAPSPASGGQTLKVGFMGSIIAFGGLVWFALV